VYNKWWIEKHSENRAHSTISILCRFDSFRFLLNWFYTYRILLFFIFFSIFTRVGIYLTTSLREGFNRYIILTFFIILSSVLQMELFNLTHWSCFNIKISQGPLPIWTALIVVPFATSLVLRYIYKMLPS
jgi:hypothetical protein